MSKWTQNEIKRVLYNAHVVYRDARLTIKTARTTAPQGRLIAVVPKKIGSAPERNLIKRRIRALFFEKKFAETGLDWVFFIKQPIAHVPFSELSALVDTIATKLPIATNP